MHLLQQTNVFVQHFSRLASALYSSVKRQGFLSQMTNLNKLFCSALKCQFEKKNTHMLRHLFHSEKGELSDCPQPNVSKGPLEITGAVRVRATQAAP